MTYLKKQLVYFLNYYYVSFSRAFWTDFFVNIVIIWIVLLLENIYIFVSAVTFLCFKVYVWCLCCKLKLNSSHSFCQTFNIWAPAQHIQIFQWNSFEPNVNVGSCPARVLWLQGVLLCHLFVCSSSCHSGKLEYKSLQILSTCYTHVKAAKGYSLNSFQWTVQSKMFEG